MFILLSFCSAIYFLFHFSDFKFLIVFSLWLHLLNIFSNGSKNSSKNYHFYIALFFLLSFLDVFNLLLLLLFWFIFPSCFMLLIFLKGLVIPGWLSTFINGRQGCLVWMAHERPFAIVYKDLGGRGRADIKPSRQAGSQFPSLPKYIGLDCCHSTLLCFIFEWSCLRFCSLVC